MIRTCWELGRLQEFAELKLWKWAHMLGFRGHFSTKSRAAGYSPGASLLAAAVWHRRELERQFIAEGGC
ncbi:MULTISPECIES: replication initiator [unclassified Streptomyces]|uniref:replication initiator n=1 Tax=unclassified Streptomyces TaxID=2593676 RepID=UPI0004C6FA67